MRKMERIGTWLGSEWNEWESPGGTGLKVSYKAALDGGGTFAADWFLDFFRKRYPSRRFRRAFEWCSGPGFIGFALLEAGICDELVLADVNPEAIECVQHTLTVNSQFSERVKYYISDNLRQIPNHEHFDLIIANPPYATRGNPKYIHDRRTLDPDWQLHAAFFRTIRTYLDSDALLCVSELCPLESNPEHDIHELTFPHFDHRERPPIEDLLPHIRQGGLRLTEIVNATGESPLVRLTSRSPAVRLDRSNWYIDWFWILVIELDKRGDSSPQID